PCHRWIVFGVYEGGEGIEFAQGRLKNGGVFVDSGANIGQWLLYLGEIEALQTLAFEPVSSQRNWLIECIETQQNWEVVLFEYALGNKQDTQDIQCNGARSTFNMDWYAGKGLVKQRVQIRRLDQVLAEQQIDEVTLWKIDVEGTELQALQGATDYLKAKRIKTIYFECIPTNFNRICELLHSYGYFVYELNGGKLTETVKQSIVNTQHFVAVPGGANNQQEGIK
ncbi:MAG: FkbM family methyltransferase, partial [bacterium]